MTTTTTAASRSHVEKGWSVAFAPCQNIPQVPLRPLLARKKTPMAWPSRHDVTECRVASTRGEGSRPESSVAAALLIAHKNFPRSLPTGFVGPRAKSCPSLLNFPPLSLGRDDLGSIHLYSKPTDSAPFIVYVCVGIHVHMCIHVTFTHSHMYTCAFRPHGTPIFQNILIRLSQ